MDIWINQWMNAIMDEQLFFYKLIYCRYKTSKIQVLNLTFEILIKYGLNCN